ncbi:MAG: Gfo/Idh/MocA family oxidoreductase [Thermoleophilia bacterium]|nr:Gfo/Idh/MocA family oxidoreductase [Thermoleophilia bacterium]
MTRAVKWGLLSTADINGKLLAGAAESDEVEVVAVASRTTERAEEYARTWGIERAYGTYDELLADPDVEAIYNPLPNTMHSEWSIRALEAGKHVLCEKPFSRHIGDVEAAFDAADRTGLHLSEAFMYRHHPQTARLAELVAEGAIGDLRVIRTAFSYSLYDAENIRLRTDVDGGALMDVGCYCISGARLLGGEPESVLGAAHIGSSGTDWVFSGLLRFPGDVTALFDCGTALPNRDELEAIGTEGSIFLDDPWHCQTPVIELRRDEAVERIEVEPANPYRLELEDMNAAIRGERQPLLGRADALGQVRALDALFRSAAEQQVVAL